MKKYFGLFLLFLLVLFIGIETAMACTCSGRPQGVKGVQTCGYYWGTENVFIGLAEKIEIDREIGSMKVTFSVEKSIRGTNEKTVEIFTSSSTASCGYPFKEGERYFVYGRKRNDGKYHESLCGPTTLLKDAEDDLEYVKEIESGKTGSRIYGNVYEDRQASYKDKRAFEPLADIEITIKGQNKKNKFKTKTDEKGFYIFKEIPQDTYRVTAKFPDGLRETFVREDLTEHFAGVNLNGVRCDQEGFMATRQGSIRGKVVGYDGTDAPQLSLSLLPLDENNKAILEYSPFKAVWANKLNSEFYFNLVPSGKYLLAVNPKNCPLQPTHDILRQKNLEFGRMFFNGGTNESEAQIITVGESQQVKLGDFRILPPLKERWFSGIVLSADKKPLANARVFLVVDSQQCAIYSNIAEVKTDEFGHFRIKGFETYGYKLRAYIETDKQTQTRLFSKLFELPAEGNAENIELIADSTY